MITSGRFLVLGCRDGPVRIRQARGALPSAVEPKERQGGGLMPTTPVLFV